MKLNDVQNAVISMLTDKAFQLVQKPWDAFINSPLLRPERVV